MKSNALVVVISSNLLIYYYYHYLLLLISGRNTGGDKGKIKKRPELKYTHNIFKEFKK